MAKKPGRTLIQTYLACPSGFGVAIGASIDLQPAVEMVQTFNPVMTPGEKCFPCGDVELSFTVDKKYNKGTLTFVLPFDKQLGYLCETCSESCKKLKIDPKQKMETCAERIRMGYCKDPVISKVIGEKLFPHKYK